MSRILNDSNRYVFPVVCVMGGTHAALPTHNQQFLLVCQYTKSLALNLNFKSVFVCSFSLMRDLHKHSFFSFIRENSNHSVTNIGELTIDEEIRRPKLK